jgi:hypothetical protein
MHFSNALSCAEQNMHSKLEVQPEVKIQNRLGHRPDQARALPTRHVSYVEHLCREPPS